MLSSTSPVPPDPSSAPFFSEEDSKSLPAALKNVAISRFEGNVLLLVAEVMLLP